MALDDKWAMLLMPGVPGAIQTRGSKLIGKNTPVCQGDLEKLGRGHARESESIHRS